MQPTTRTSPVRAWVEAHLASRDVAHVIYGTVVGLALVEALERHPPGAWTMAALLVATAVAIGLAELYSEALSAEARTRRAVRGAQLRELALESTAVVFGAGFPSLFFVLAALGAFDLSLAFSLAQWSGIGLIFVYGFLSARLAGFSVVGCLLHGAAVGLVGAGLIALKSLLH